MYDLETIKHTNSAQGPGDFQRKTITRDQAMRSPAVHNLTKEVLKLSEGRDIIDRYHDVALAAKILKDEMELELR